MNPRIWWLLSVRNDLAVYSRRSTTARGAATGVTPYGKPLSAIAGREPERYAAVLSPGQPNGDAAYAHGSNVARPEADGGVQESLPGTTRARKQSRREKSTATTVWEGYRERLCKCKNFNENGL